MVKKLRRSAGVKRPFPSARLVLMERESRFSGKKAEAAVEAGSELADFVGEVEGFLVNEQVLEQERHGS